MTVSIESPVSTTTAPAAATEKAVKNVPRFTLRRSNERGGADHGWLNTKHTFSFAGYYDRRFEGFGPLRVLNEDFVEPDNGFGAHGHRYYEIFSYIVDGSLEHRDSMGNKENLPRGYVQFTSAGTGITHSEMNRSKKDSVHFLQLWAKPDTKDLRPSYATTHVPDEAKLDKPHLTPLIIPSSLQKQLVAAKKEYRGSDALTQLIGIHQDLYMFASLLNSGKTTRHEPVGDNRIAYLHVVMTGTDAALEVSTADGSVKASLKEGDGLFINDLSQANELVFKSVGGGRAEFVFLDMTSDE
ncbi:hypothetical protein HDU96_009584 [Phlyctochytrium bullatum]|nr:hypothetical protein HDU96_009584 [Phlyctochytrium bullatum]